MKVKVTTLLNRGLDSGLTISRIAKGLGIMPNTVYLWKAGKSKPNSKNMAKLDRLINTHMKNSNHIDMSPNGNIRVRPIEELVNSENHVRENTIHTDKKKQSLVEPHEPEMTLDQAHWDGFKEGLKRGIEITEEQFKDYESTR